MVVLKDLEIGVFLMLFTFFPLSPHLFSLEIMKYGVKIANVNHGGKRLQVNSSISHQRSRSFNSALKASILLLPSIPSYELPGMEG